MHMMLMDSQYDHVISLGRGCQPAYQIRRILGIETAYPFDWILTTDLGLLALIETRLDGFFSRDRLGVAKNGLIVDLPTETQFAHEFPTGTDFDSRYEMNAGRFEMLAHRWNELLNSKQRILFVRQHAWIPDRRGSAQKLRAAIKRQAPALAFTILYLTAAPEDEISWNEYGIINRQLTQLEPYEWQGDGAAWERLLGDAFALRVQA